MEARLAKIRAKEKAQRDKYLKGDQTFKKRRTDANAEDEDDEDQYLLDDYESDDESKVFRGKGGGSSVFSAATLELMKQAGMGPIESTDEADELVDEIKVSRIST